MSKFNTQFKLSKN